MHHLAGTIALSLLFICVQARAQTNEQWQKVRSAYDRGNIYAGLRHAEKQLSGRRADRAFLILRAEGRNRIGEYARAADDARQAWELFTGDTAKLAAQQLGIAYMEMGASDSAAHWLERSLGTAQDGEARLRLARLDLLRQDHGKALRRLNDLLEKDPDHVKALLERGAVHTSGGDTAQARRDLDKAVELAPKDPVAWNARGFHLHAARGDHARAIADYDRAIKLDPNYSFAFNNRGWSLFKLGEVEKAKKNIRLAAKKRPGNPYIHRNLGMIALEEGDLEVACTHFKNALSLNFEQLYGPEVSVLVRQHCTGTSTAPAQSTTPVQEVPPTRSNAPVRSNAP